MFFLVVVTTNPVLDCTYNQPSHRRRNPTPKLLEAMERKLNRAEALLRVSNPEINLDDPSIDELLEQGFAPTRKSPHTLSQAPPPPPGGSSSRTTQQNREPDLESMLHATGLLEVDQSGNFNYHGDSSSLTFLRRMGQEFRELKGSEKIPSTVTPTSTSRKMSDFLRTPNMSPSSFRDSPAEPNVGIEDLPSRNVAYRLCRHALDEACTIMPCVHQPTFYASLDRIYSIPTEQHGNDDHRFLALLYVVLAVGCLFAKEERSDLLRKGYQSATDEG